MSAESPEKTVGTILREAREAKGFSVQDLHEKTRILPQYIELLEQDTFDFLPEPYVRGFVRSISEQLGIDPEPLLERIYEILHPPELEEVEEEAVLRPGEKAEIVEAKPRRTGDVILLTLGLIVVTALVVGYLRYGERWFGPRTHEVKQIPLEEALREAEQPRASRPGAPRQEPQPPRELRLGMRTTDSCWVRVVVNDTLAYEYLFGPGGTKELVATGSLYLKTGNAGGLLLTLNGQEMGSLGDPGEVVELWIGVDGKVEKRGRRGRVQASVSPQDSTDRRQE